MRFILYIAAAYLAFRLLAASAAPYTMQSPWGRQVAQAVAATEQGRDPTPFAGHLNSGFGPAQWGRQLVNASQTIARQITQGLPR